MLYHGSNSLIAGQLEPRISFDYEPLVYATDDYMYALLRAGKFNPNKFLIKEDYNGMDHPIQLIEIVPGAFKETFETPGYIYLVDGGTFKPHGKNEYVSTTPVRIKQITPITDIWTYISNNPRFKLICYEDSEPYWNTVRGGKEEYLKKRQERVDKLKEVRHD